MSSVSPVASPVDRADAHPVRCHAAASGLPCRSATGCHPGRVPDDDAYWRWRDALLKHPDGRAVGGEPCVRCDNPIPPTAVWSQRDRHVCSSECSMKLARWFTRARDAGKFDTTPEPLPNPRTAPVPSRFATLGPDSPVPYEFDGYGPLPGDIVERHGAVTAYELWPADAAGVNAEHGPHGWFVATHLGSGMVQMHAATAGGEASRTQWGEYNPDGTRRTHGEPWNWQGSSYRWAREIAHDLTPDGTPYNWQANVCVPAAAAHRVGTETPAYAAFAAARARSTASTARHSRRVRLADATVERFDPVEIYDRDGWICALCHQPIDPQLRWPEPMSVSLDHVVPLVGLGEHSRANTQASHWICNVRKGGRLVQG